MPNKQDEPLPENPFEEVIVDFEDDTVQSLKHITIKNEYCPRQVRKTRTCKSNKMKHFIASSHSSTLSDKTPNGVVTHNQFKALRRYKREERIYVNLKEGMDVNFHVRKKNVITTTRCTKDKFKEAGTKKVTFSVTKVKPPSNLKKIFLLDRKIRAYIKAQNRLNSADERIQIPIEAVSEINLDSLKITADPSVDFDLVKHCCALAMYSKDFRDPKVIQVTEDIHTLRTDVTNGFDKLCINEADDSDKDYCEQLVTDRNSPLDTDILLKTGSLQINDQEENTTDTKSIIQTQMELKFSQKFREYCTNTLTKPFNTSLETFLQNIVRLQRRLYEKDNIKGRHKRRYYVGLQEVKKHIERNNIKFVLIAPDIEKVQLHGGLDDRVYNLMKMCKDYKIVCCFGLRRRKLGYYMHGKGTWMNVACVA